MDETLTQLVTGPEGARITSSIIAWTLFLQEGASDPEGTTDVLMDLTADELRGLIVGALACEVVRVASEHSKAAE